MGIVHNNDLYTLVHKHQSIPSIPLSLLAMFNEEKEIEVVPVDTQTGQASTHLPHTATPITESKIERVPEKRKYSRIAGKGDRDANKISRITKSCIQCGRRHYKITPCIAEPNTTITSVDRPAGVRKRSRTTTCCHQCGHGHYKNTPCHKEAPQGGLRLLPGDEEKISTVLPRLAPSSDPPVLGHT